jgi:DNA-binding GntR family transcriptional regulator
MPEHLTLGNLYNLQPAGSGCARKADRRRKVLSMEKINSKISKIEFRPTGMAEKLAETLSNAIREGIFKEGDQLIELDLQKQLGISRTPIRESFRVLEKEGLVEVIPHKGTFVKRISRKDIEEHFPVRAPLEGIAAKHAYLNKSADMLRAMEQIFAQMKTAAENKDTNGFLKHHNLFHEAFIDACGNQLLINLLKNLRKQIIWYRLTYRYYDEDLQKSLRVHEAILKMFKNKGTDLMQLETAVRNHINEGGNAFLCYMDELEPPK